MQYLLFIFYFFGLYYCLTKIKFVTNSGINKKSIFILFTIKILAGIGYGLVCNYLFNHSSDYNNFDTQSRLETSNLFHNPKLFFTDIFYSNYKTYGDVFIAKQSYWNDLPFNIILKILSFLNLINWGSFYISNLYLNFILFLGGVALFKVFKHIYLQQNLTLIIGCFLLPSTLYYTSGVSKELFVFVGLCFFLNALYFSVVNRFTAKRIFVLIISFLLIFLIRNYIAVMLFPCVAIFILSYKLKANALKSFAIFFILALVTIAIMDYYKLKNNPLNLIAKRQDSFINLGIANTDFKYDTLQPTLKSFAAATPKSFRNVFLSPLPFEFNSKITLIYFAEMLGYYLLLFTLIFYHKKNNNDKSFTIFTVVFSFILMMVIGYTITNFGAVVRYRSLYLPFLITPILCGIDWQKIKAKFNRQS